MLIGERGQVEHVTGNVSGMACADEPLPDGVIDRLWILFAKLRLMVFEESFFSDACV